MNEVTSGSVRIPPENTLSRRALVLQPLRGLLATNVAIAGTISMHDGMGKAVDGTLQDNPPLRAEGIVQSTMNMIEVTVGIGLITGNLNKPSSRRGLFGRMLGAQAAILGLAGTAVAELGQIIPQGRTVQIYEPHTKRIQRGAQAAVRFIDTHVSPTGSQETHQIQAPFVTPTPSQ